MFENLPRYQCHKIVRAAKIVDFSIDRATLCVDVNGTQHPVAVGGNWMAKHLPVIGGYFVVYDDGYTSYSPAKAFDDGYTRLSDDPAVLDTD